MFQSLPVVTLDDVRTRGIELTTDEAVAIVFQLGHRLSWKMAPPPAHGILLQSDGRVNVRWPHEADHPTAVAFASLLHRLLPEPGGERRRAVPGGLRLLVARSLGGSPLPPIVTAPEFAAALQRFVDTSDLDAVAERIAGVVHRAIVAAEPIAVRARVPERRATGPSVTELRRQLQEADLARYSLISQLGRPPRAAAPVLSIGRLMKPARALAPASLQILRTASWSARARPSAASRWGGYARSFQRLPVARATGIAALATALLLCVVVDQPLPERPRPPAQRYAAELPELPVPIALLEAPLPTPVVDAPASSSTLRAGVRQVTDTRSSTKRNSKREQNKFLRFVKSLFEA